MRQPIRMRVLVGLAIAGGIGVVALANIHLLWASLLSQPDCVQHLKAPGTSGQFRAAQPSC